MKVHLTTKELCEFCQVIWVRRRYRTQREDDRQGVIKERLDAYQEWTEPVVEYYEKAAYFKIDGNRSPQEVFTTIENCVKKYQITQSKSLAPLQ